MIRKFNHFAKQAIIKETVLAIYRGQEKIHLRQPTMPCCRNKTFAVKNDVDSTLADDRNARICLLA